MKKVTEQDKGTDIFTLVRVSHIHPFGLTFVFCLVGTIFGHAYMRPVWLKCAVIAAPYPALVTDIGSWYMIKLYHSPGSRWVPAHNGRMLCCDVSGIDLSNVVFKDAWARLEACGCRNFGRLIDAHVSASASSDASSGRR